MSDEETVTIKRKWPEAHYPGSLIMQNHGEEMDHGFLVWRSNQKSPEFVELENEYGFYTLDVESATLPVKSDVPEKPRLRLRIKNTSGVEVRRIVEDVRELYDVQQLSVMRVDDSDESVNGERGKSAIGDLTSTSYQNDLIIDYVKRNFPATDDIVSEIRKINTNLNKKLDEEDLINNIKWKPKKFEFSNMFSYGEDNAIDFEKMGGIIGLFADNATGKSSIFDALCFCLFDKSTRAYKTDQILNNSSEWFECKLRFEIEGTDYVIHRKGEKKRDRIPVDVDFYRILDDGSKENLNGEQRYDTNANIREYVGEYDDFILTTLSVQNDNTLFIEKSQSERKDILAQFMGLNIFDKLYDLGRDKKKHIEATLDEHDKSDLQEKIENCSSKLEEKKKKLENKKSEKENLEDSKSELTSNLMDVNKSMSNIENVDIDIEEMKSKYVESRKAVENLEDSIKQKEIRRRELQQAIGGLESYLDQFDEKALKEEKEKQEEYKSKISDLKTKLKYKKKDIEDAKDEKDHLSHQEFNPDCEYCVERNKRDARKLEEVKNEIESLSEDIESVKNSIKDTKSKLDEEVQEKWSKFQDKKNKKQKHEKKLSNVKIEHSNLVNDLRDKENLIEEIENKIQSYNEAKEKIEENKKLEKKADKLNQKLKTVKENISNVESNIRSIHSDIQVLNRDKERAEENLSKIEGLSVKYQAYEYYLESIKRDGVPYELISRFIPQIEQHINSILSQIVDFNVVMEVDGKNINAYIAYNENEFWALELGSGMEKFVSSLAIRAALINISNLPRPNFLAIDEGFGNLDSENMSSVYQLFDYLKTSFEFIMVISHIDVMRDEVDDLIEIESNEYSSVQY